MNHLRRTKIVVTLGPALDDPEMLKRQRGVLWDFLQQMGKSLLSGGDAMKTAFPVYINDPRSYLDVICDGWTYAPTFLTRAAATADPLERLKLVATSVISGLLNTCSAGKPFNPVLGETFQASFPDGTLIYTEQTSHHPPITAWQVIGPDNCYQLTGYGEWLAAFNGNKVTGSQRGRFVVDFPALRQQVVYTLGKAQVGGVMWGERYIEYDGEFLFLDVQNRLKGVVTIPIPGTSGGWFTSRKLPSDHFTGEITNTDSGEVVARCAGAWTGAMEWDGVRYWTWSDPGLQHTPLPRDQLLESDASLRQDVVLLASGDSEKASLAKLQIEERQRRDKKLREAAKAPK